MASLHQLFREQRTEIRTRVTTDPTPHHVERVVRDCLRDLGRRFESEAAKETGGSHFREAHSSVVIDSLVAGTTLDGLIRATIVYEGRPRSKGDTQGALDQRRRDGHTVLQGLTLLIVRRKVLGSMAARLLPAIVLPTLLTVLVLVVVLAVAASAQTILAVGVLLAVQLTALRFTLKATRPASVAPDLSEMDSEPVAEAVLRVDPDALVENLEQRILAADRLLDHAEFLANQLQPGKGDWTDDKRLLEVFQGLLSESGMQRSDFSQARRDELRSVLSARGIQALEYTDELDGYFDKAPAIPRPGSTGDSLGPRTLRPAMVREGRLLMAGRVELPPT